MRTLHRIALGVVAGVTAFGTAHAQSSWIDFTGEDSGSFALSRQAHTGSLTRAEVMADAQAARASGALHALTGEDSGSFPLARMDSPSRRDSTLTRAQVLADARAARSSHEIEWFDAEDSGSSHMNLDGVTKAMTSQRAYDQSTGCVAPNVAAVAPRTGMP
jgi:hypothetical protein